MKKSVTLILVFSFLMVIILGMLSCSNQDESSSNGEAQNTTTESTTSISGNESETGSNKETQTDTSGVETTIEPTIYNVIINPNNGEDSYSLKVKEGDKLERPSDPTKEYCEFIDWIDEEGNTWVFSEMTVTKDTVIYAHYTSPVSYTKVNVKRDWKGKTLNVLASQYSIIGRAQGPWTIPEIKWGNDKLGAEVWGESMVAAVNDRAAKVKELYGIVMNWMPSSKDKFNISKDIAAAVTSNSQLYDIAVLRCMDSFTFAQNNYCYDLANCDYINFDCDYYSQDAWNMFSVAGHTLFADGSITFVNEEASYLLVYNKDLLKSVADDDLYEKVKAGTWTWDEFVKLARIATKGEGDSTDSETYGAFVEAKRMYEYFGVKGFDKDNSTGMYEISLNKDTNKLYNVVEKIREYMHPDSSDWTVNRYVGDSSPRDLFQRGRVLFFNEIAQKINNLIPVGSFSMGVVPFPKIDQYQAQYHTPVSNFEGTLACIPKTSKDREMSNYFFDVLFWTADEYIMDEYYNYKETAFDANTAEIDLQIMKDYIWSSIEFEVAYIEDGYTDIFSGAKSELVSADNMDEFNAVLPSHIGTIKERLDEINSYYSNYN